MSKRVKSAIISLMVILVILILFGVAVFLLKIDLMKFFTNPTTILVIFVAMTMAVCLGLATYFKEKK